MIEAGGRSPLFEQIERCRAACRSKNVINDEPQGAPPVYNLHQPRYSARYGMDLYNAYVSKQSKFSC